MHNNFRSLLLFTALAATFGPTVGQLNSACFGPGGTVGDCSAYIAQFCANIAQNNVSPSNTISQCFNTPDKLYKCDLTAVNTLSVVNSPSQANCKTALTTIGQNCPMGGDGIFTGATFEFVIDPNNGTCGLPCGD
ncbi:hypothetical protein C8R47DRAFT_590318 [Mycena vitilis]|nr:hypothetical protein C8R47DRAFT_590318 [Mycena vitilis]